MYQRKRNWYMVWRQCKCNIDWTVLHNSRLCIKRKFHRNRCMRLAVAYCYPKNLRASGIRTRVVEVKYDIKISVRKICNWASFSVICWIRIEMCNDTEASLEADWEGYKSIWLSLNSPLFQKPIAMYFKDGRSRCDKRKVTWLSDVKSQSILFT